MVECGLPKPEMRVRFPSPAPSFKNQTRTTAIATSSERIGSLCSNPPRLVVLKAVRYGFAVSTLSEIEAAADALTPEQKQELLLFLAARLRAQGAKLPEPRKFSREQIANWIGRDEADMHRFRQGS